MTSSESPLVNGDAGVVLAVGERGDLGGSSDCVRCNFSWSAPIKLYKQ